MKQGSIEVPGREGHAFRVPQGSSARIVNTHGSQVVDMWAYNAENLDEYMSMPCVRRHIMRLSPQRGDVLVTNRRRPILRLVEDTGDAQHDTLLAACDRHSYALAGVQGYHENCSDNLRMSMRRLGLKVDDIPAPLNLWMNIPVGDGGKLSLDPPQSKPGDHVTFRAEMDAIIVLSCCPNDVHEINGVDRAPKAVRVEIEA